MSNRKFVALVSTLNVTVEPRSTLMSVAKPWMDESPAPLTSHSLAAFPARQFSATTAFGGAAQMPPVGDVVDEHVKFAASALPARSLTPDAPPTTVAVYCVDAASAPLGVSVAVKVAAL